MEERLPDTYACINKDNITRKESSSGGIFTLLATNILEKNGVVFGVAFDEDLNAHHICVQDVDDLKYIRGSKYVQSNLEDSFKKTKEFLREERPVLFTGTPCQIESLKKFLNADTKIDSKLSNKIQENLYTQDIICHGMPMKKIWLKYLKEKKERSNSSTIKRFSFRNKENNGWSKYQILIEYDNGVKEYIDYTDDIYMKIFLSDIALLNSCYDCKCKKKLRESDITLADFWGINNVCKEMNDEKGTSLVFIHSRKGKKLFEEIKEKIIFKKVDFYESIQSNPAMIQSAKMHRNREAFLGDIDKLSLDELYKKYSI